jgi:hypothetical protein
MLMNNKGELLEEDGSQIEGLDKINSFDFDNNQFMVSTLIIREQ